MRAVHRLASALIIFTGGFITCPHHSLADITSGLVVNLAFTETSGTVATNTGSGSNGVLINFPTNDSQWLGTALAFDGANDYVQVMQTGFSSYTFSAYLTPSGTAGTPFLWLTNGDINSNNGSLLVNGGRFSHYAITSIGQIWANGTTPVVPGTTYHVIGVFSDNSYTELYVNGKREALISGTIGSAITVGADRLWLGHAGNGNTGTGIGSGVFGSAYFSGSMGDIRMYNRALTGTVDANGVLIGGDLYELTQAVPEPRTCTLAALSGGLVLALRLWRSRSARGPACGGRAT